MPNVFVNFSLYLSQRVFVVLFGIITVYLFSFAYYWLYGIAQLSLLIFGFLILLDIVLLYIQAKGIEGKRETMEKLSNGDKNEVFVYLENHYSFPIRLKVIDEIPFQFQIRDLVFWTKLESGKTKKLKYTLRPTERGVYEYGALNVFVYATLGLAVRRYRFAQNTSVAVYPSYLQMRKYELLAISNRLTEVGVKKIRRIGHHTEFEQIKEYVRGDDIRTINWKATARRGQIMVNQYQDERSQQVYSVIDKGRQMKLPFEGMSLVDYAINASLVISNIAILRQDKAGLLTFDHNISTLLPASRQSTQMRLIQETLYKQNTSFKEPSYDKLYAHIRKHITHRSLILLYTNFSTLSSMRRQLPYLKRIAFNHLLVIIFFENTELEDLIERTARDTEEVYLQTIAEKFAYEKKQIVKELRHYGIYAVLTTPQNLTVDTINQYLEFKSRGLI